jgi:hypothetical protein
MVAQQKAAVRKTLRAADITGKKYQSMHETYVRVCASRESVCYDNCAVTFAAFAGY